MLIPDAEETSGACRNWCSLKGRDKEIIEFHNCCCSYPSSLRTRSVTVLKQNAVTCVEGIVTVRPLVFTARFNFSRTQLPCESDAGLPDEG